MKLIIDVDEGQFKDIKRIAVVQLELNHYTTAEQIIANGKVVPDNLQGWRYEETPQQGEWNNHTVACLLADLFGDPCACNHCGIDEWLPKKCDFANKECPDVVGVACWEQFLKHRKGGAT